MVSFSLAAEGVLRWISLSLACYQGVDGRGSTFLLFNPAQDDKPLEDLSTRFQQLLEEREYPPLYFPNDQAKTSLQFWSRITGAAKTAKCQREVKEREAKRVETEARCIPIMAVLTDPVAPPRDPASGFAEEVFIADQCLRSCKPYEASVAYRRAFEYLIALLGKVPASGEATPEQIEQLRKSDAVNDEQRKSLDQRAQVYRDLAADYAGIQALYGELLLKTLSDEVWELRSLARNFGIDETVPADFRQSFDELQKLEQEVKKLHNLIEQAPTIQYLQAADHPAILRKALREATSSIVIISPWIKIGVVSRLMNDFRNALGRSVEIWIGYGMPDSSKHDDESDPKAIQKLQQLAVEGYLFLVKFGKSLRERGTHEKVLIQDQNLCVIGSYNWLSYDARDNTRREMSILIKGQAHVEGFQSQIMRQLEQAGRDMNIGLNKTTGAN
ncbi:MAG: phospholipase D-like domain-containing protein [Terriglobia bacterium]